MTRCLHVNKITGELLLYMIYFSKYQILQGPSYCFLCHLVFLLLIFTPPGCGPTVVWRESIAWWPVPSNSSLPPLYMQPGALNFIFETRTSRCGQCVTWRAVTVQKNKAAWLLPACDLSAMCTLNALHGWFLSHHSIFDSIWKHWISSLHGPVFVQSCWDWGEVDPVSQVCTQPVQASALVWWELLFLRCVM